MEKILKSVEEMVVESGSFASTLLPQQAGATLVTLSGELGAGKTTFTQGVARALGVTDTVTSPTFVLEKMYDLPETAPFLKLVHVDAYRLTKGSDLVALDFASLLIDPTNLILLEWPERVLDGLPPATYALAFRTNSDGSRTLTYA